MAVLERVLELYREKYFDFNLRHFVEKPRLLLVNYETGHIVCQENRTF